METIILHPKNKSEAKALKAFAIALGIDFTVPKQEAGESPYDPEFVKMIKEGEEALKSGEGTSITVDDLWK
jgi:hypothetical protein